MSEELRTALGARRPTGSIAVTLHVPSLDRDGQPVDQGFWTQEALKTFGTLFRGATAFPVGRGVWRDDERGGTLLFEDIQMVTSFVEPEVLESPEVQADLASFLHRLGRETDQGEIGIVIDGEYYGVEAEAWS